MRQSSDGPLPICPNTQQVVQIFANKDHPLYGDDKEHVVVKEALVSILSSYEVEEQRNTGQKAMSSVRVSTVKHISNPKGCVTLLPVRYDATIIIEMLIL